MSFKVIGNLVTRINRKSHLFFEQRKRHDLTENDLSFWYKTIGAQIRCV